MRPNPAEQPDPRVVYADIIDLPHHRSDHHPPMSLMDRAAQFSAYKALSGYEEMIGEEARPVDAKIELGEAELDLLNQKLNLLQETLQQGREVSLAITHLVKPGIIDLMTLLKRISYTPAQVYKLNAGFIREQGPADVVLFDPEARKTYYSFQSRSQNTPFARIPLFGEVKCTICDGKIAYVRTMEG